ncbi:MAG: cytochrome c554 family protein [Nitrospiraceae bacterium]|nr:MAG: cytochrome c554 family protein [Nitrospiraceae bacterium]
MKGIILIFVILLTAADSSASSGEGEKIFKENCGKCHTYERSLSKTKDFEAWKRTTLRMAGYSRWEISSKEAEEVAEYLTAVTSEKAGAPHKEEAEIEDIDKMEKHELFDFRKVRVNQFIDPDVCEVCHTEIFNQWNGSMHSKAFADPLWRAATKFFYKDAKTSDEIMEMKACVKCHTPLGFRSYAISSPADDYDKLAELPAQGIFCNWCHNISEVKHLGDAGYEVEAGGGEDDPSTMLGPFKDSDSPYHPSKYSELHTKSEFCALCHNVSHAANKLPIEQTYNEWKNSPYNTGNPATTVNCQDCHMRQRPGIPSTGKTVRPDNPGQACNDGPQREHLWTHYFVGANAVVTKLLGSELHSTMAVERLQNAADLEIIRESVYRKNQLSNIKVKVINSGAGHYLPTGLTEVREMWLDVKITDAKGKVLLRSGELDAKGEIDANAVVYHTKLGNEKGEAVVNVAKADRILYDHRIPPKGYHIERYSFYIPSGAVSPLNVEVRLKYRSISQPLAKVLLGDNTPMIPVIDMVRADEKINF